MKKLLRNAMWAAAAIIGLANATPANAWYLIGGNVDGDSWGTWYELKETATNTYTWTGSVLGSGFKLKSVNSWDISGTELCANGTLNSLDSNYTPNTSGDNIEFGGTLKDKIIKNPTLTLTVSGTTYTLKLTGTAQDMPTETGVLGEYVYVIGDITNWQMTDEFKLAKTTNGTYSGKIVIPAGASYFRIYSSIEYGSNAFSYGPSAQVAINTSSTFSGSMTYGEKSNCWYTDKDWKGGYVDITCTINGSTNPISCTTTVAEVYPDNVYLMGNFNNWDNGTDYLNYELTNNGENVYSGKFEIPATVDQAYPEFKIYAPGGFGWWGTAKTDGNEAVTLTSGTVTELTLSNVSDGKNFVLNEWNGGEIEFTLDWSAHTLSLLYTEAPTESTATFYFMGSDEYNDENDEVMAYEWVSLMVNGDEEDLDGAMYELKFTEEANIFISSKDNEQYVVDVEIEEYTMDTFNDSGLGEFSFDGAIWNLVLYAGTDGLTINVTVLPKDAVATEVSLTFNVTPADGSGLTGDVSDLVSMSYFNKSTYDDDEVLSGEAVTVVAGTNFTFKPAEGYIITEISNFTGLDGIATVSAPAIPTGEWYVSVAEIPTNTEAFLFVYVAEAPDFVTVDFTSQTIKTFPENYVNVTSEDDVTITKTTGNVVIIPEDGLTFTVAPVTEMDEEYIIMSVTVVDAEGNAIEADNLSTYGVTLQGDEEGYTVTLTSEANGLTFTFDVEDKNAVGISKVGKVLDGSEVIYNLQGVRVDRNHLGKGIYIINGKKVAVK